ncbi:hypothetical protein EUGRSUZ_J02856 [Eucalyptus grandis]|uniref:Uncharacterized protein n=2 Tax=Eucalyptus grandis TaxID=71139 RepID=A0ACC3J9S0_EUCGR|nr:hypothetical protein EUGRSUZ_J02856 [Eucalyptus grandis]
MADRPFPPTTKSPAAANGGGLTANGSFPATKGQLYGEATRSAVYRPQPMKGGGRRRHRRGCCCRCCLWTTVALLVLLLLIGAAAAVFYVLYRPQRPTFTVTSLKVSYINITTSSSTLSSKFDLTVSARNPNSKLVYIYSPTSVSVDSTAASALKSGLKSKNGLALKIRLETKVKVKIGGLKTPRVGIRVTCGGIRATAPAAGKSAATASTASAKCKVDTRIRIWNWTL